MKKLMIGIFINIMLIKIGFAGVPKSVVSSLNPHKIVGIDFYKGKHNQGVIKIIFQRSVAKFNINKKDKIIRVDFSRTDLPIWLEKKFSVKDFKTLVKSFQAKKIKTNVSVSIYTSGNNIIKTREKNKTLILSITAEGAAKSTTTKKQSRLISLSFQSISVRALLQLMAKLADKNIVLSSHISGGISLNLHGIDWQKTLNIILRSKGLSEENIDGVYIIAPAQELAKEELAEIQSRQKLQLMEPLATKVIKIHYAKAQSVASFLQGARNSLLSKRGRVSADIPANTLWLEDTPDKLQQLQSIIKQLDTPPKEVLIEAKIVNLDKSYEQQLGIKWGVENANPETPTLDKPNYFNGVNIDLPATGIGEANGAASLGLALAKLNNGALLNLQLSALATNGNAKIIASPRLITLEHKQAIIASGHEIPYQEAAGNGTTAVAFKKAVLSLKVTPQITPHNKIELSLTVNQDKPGANILKGVPSIDTREIKTQVLLKNGQTIVLGGIYQKSMANQVTRVPFLSDIPIVGHLFQHTTKQTQQTELLIFVTPKIISS